MWGGMFEKHQVDIFDNSPHGAEIEIRRVGRSSSFQIVDMSSLSKLREIEIADYHRIYD